MGFTLTRSTGTSAAFLGYRTPEQEAIDKADHQMIQAIERRPPVTIGTEKQINWAKSIARAFLFHAHAWNFTPADIDLLFANNGKYAKFWIDNRNPSGNSGEGYTRAAVERELDKLKGIAQADDKANRAIAAMTPAQLAAKVRRL